MKLLQFTALADGTTDEHCGRYLVFYDPGPHRLNGDYDGGLLLTTANPDEALKFTDSIQAFEVWKTPATCKCHGIRKDGKLNRPLTAYTVSVIEAPK